MKGAGFAKGKGKMAAPAVPPISSRPKLLARGQFRAGEPVNFAAEENCLQSRQQQVDSMSSLEAVGENQNATANNFDADDPAGSDHRSGEDNSSSDHEGKTSDHSGGTPIPIPGTGDGLTSFVRCPRCKKRIRAEFFEEHWSSHSSRLLPWLYLGGRRNAENASELIKRTRITHILNVACELHDILPLDLKGRFVEHTVPLNDTADQKLLDSGAGCTIRDAAKWIHETCGKRRMLINAGGGRAQEDPVRCPREVGPTTMSTTSTSSKKEQEVRILLHCTQGVSRSASVALAYLMEYQNFRLREAYDFVKKRRKIIDPRPNFVAELGRLECEILFPGEGGGKPTLSVEDVVGDRKFLNVDVASINDKSYQRNKVHGGEKAKEEIKSVGLGGVANFRALAARGTAKKNVVAAAGDEGTTPTCSGTSGATPASAAPGAAAPAALADNMSSPRHVGAAPNPPDKGAPTSKEQDSKGGKGGKMKGGAGSAPKPPDLSTNPVNMNRGRGGGQKGKPAPSHRLGGEQDQPRAAEQLAARMRRDLPALLVERYRPGRLWRWEETFGAALDFQVATQVLLSFGDWMQRKLALAQQKNTFSTAPRRGGGGGPLFSVLSFDVLVQELRHHAASSLAVAVLAATEEWKQEKLETMWSEDRETAGGLTIESKGLHALGQRWAEHCCRELLQKGKAPQRTGMATEARVPGLTADGGGKNRNRRTDCDDCGRDFSAKLERCPVCHPPPPSSAENKTFQPEGRRASAVPRKSQMTDEDVLDVWRGVEPLTAGQMANRLDWLGSLRAMHKIYGGSGGIWLYQLQAEPRLPLHSAVDDRDQHQAPTTSIAGRSCASTTTSTTTGPAPRPRDDKNVNECSSRRLVAGKAQRDAKELYAVLLAQDEDVIGLGLRVANMRVVHLFQEDSEYFDLLTAVYQFRAAQKATSTDTDGPLVTDEPCLDPRAVAAGEEVVVGGGGGGGASCLGDPQRQHYDAVYAQQKVMQGKQFYGILEVVRGLRTLQGLGGLHAVPKLQWERCLFDLGAMCAFDAWINNLDRIPHTALWNNDGNLQNIMIEQPPVPCAADEHQHQLVGIDQAVTVIVSDEGAKAYRKKLAAACSSACTTTSFSGGGGEDRNAGAETSSTNYTKSTGQKTGGAKWKQNLLEQIYLCTGVKFETTDSFERGLRHGFEHIGKIEDVEAVLKRVEEKVAHMFGYAITLEELKPAHEFLLANARAIRETYRAGAVLDSCS